MTDIFHFYPTIYEVNKSWSKWENNHQINLKKWKQSLVSALFWYYNVLLWWSQLANFLCNTANVTLLFWKVSMNPRATKLSSAPRWLRKLYFQFKWKKTTSKQTIITAICIIGNGIWGFNLCLGSHPAHLAGLTQTHKQDPQRLTDTNWQQRSLNSRVKLGSVTSFKYNRSVVKAFSVCSKEEREGRIAVGMKTERKGESREELEDLKADKRMPKMKDVNERQRQWERREYRDGEERKIKEEKKKYFSPSCWHGVSRSYQG